MNETVHYFFFSFFIISNVWQRGHNLGTSLPAWTYLECEGNDSLSSACTWFFGIPCQVLCDVTSRLVAWVMNSYYS